ncbi:AAA family ATPase [Hazenella sp. IB182357]|uniref:AAA family ATPase n=1 Tax=Polycladospora coralii TaxID=2771432 RepID=A0A926RUJ5_9BACL|nr:AAA family ATPase [Polycladospora coralii]MBD1372434.1 AAA family ATPase [Polycladospora coralii]MBS7531756.1 AAA family ATPase [Polycladospora coralii]
MISDIKLLIVSEEPAIATDLQERLKSSFAQITSIYASEVRREISRIQPDIVLLHEGKDGLGMQLIPYIRKEVAKAEIIYLTELKDSIRVRDASRAGAFDVLFFPDEINALNDVLPRAMKSIQTKEVKNKEETIFNWGRGQVIAVYSGKGGSGKSLVASTLAQTLQLESSSSVLLVDLNLQYGGVETFLNIEGNRNLYHLTPVLHELNDNHIRSVTVVEPNSLVEVLASPADIEIGEQVTEDHVERVLRAARLYYDFIIIDLPTEMTNIVYTALEEADKIMYILTPDAVAMRTLNRVLSLFQTVGVDPTERLEIMLNKVNRDSEIRSKEVKERFNFPLIGEFREDSKKIEQIINRGKAIRTSKNERNNSSFVKDIQKLAHMMLGKDKKNKKSKSVS